MPPPPPHLTHPYLVVVAAGDSLSRLPLSQAPSGCFRGAPSPRGRPFACEELPNWRYFPGLPSVLMGDERTIGGLALCKIYGRLEGLMEGTGRALEQERQVDHRGEWEWNEWREIRMRGGVQAD